MCIGVTGKKRRTSQGEDNGGVIPPCRVKWSGPAVKVAGGRSEYGSIQCIRQGLQNFVSLRKNECRVKESTEEREGVGTRVGE